MVHRGVLPGMTRTRTCLSQVQNTLATCLAAVCLLLAGACGGPASGPGRSVSPSSALLTCGKLPTPSSDYPIRLQLNVVSVTATNAILRVRMNDLSEKPVDLTSGSPDLYIVRDDGTLIGRSGVIRAATARVRRIIPGKPQDQSYRMAIKGCPTNDKAESPETTRRPLPPGRYEVVAVLSTDRGFLTSNKVTVMRYSAKLRSGSAVD